MSVEPDRYGVMGNPVAHSKSPLIHSLFAEQTGQNLDYQTILVEADGFQAAASAFQDGGGRGLNVTLPFKQDACHWVDRCSERARLAGAVNTIVFEADGSSRGDNTDGVGLIRDLTVNHGWQVAGRSLLVIGAGGAVRGVLPALLAQHPACLVVANRTAERARELAARFTSLGTIRGCGLNELGGQHFDLVINGTAASLSGQVPAIPDSVVRANSCCYDLAYASEPTAFVAWARRRGAALAVDGLGMLVEQAAESFLIWRGVRPDTALAISRLRVA